MKKILIILIATFSLMAVIFLGWYLFLRNPDVPAGKTIIDMLPFGSGGDTVVTTTDFSTSFNDIQNQLTGTDVFGNSTTTKLFRLSDTPVAGAVVFNKEKQTIVRYVDRATGHIYDINLPTDINPAALKKTKVTNNTLPKIYEAYFRTDGNAVLLRFLKDDSDVIENLSLALTPPQGTSTDALYTVSSTFLRGDISSVVVGPGNTLIYSLREVAAIVKSKFDGSLAKTLFASPFTNWRLAMAGDNLVIYTKASANASGFAYALNSTNGVLTKILGPLNGLVVIPNASGNRILYSYVENEKTRLFAKNLTDNTLSEKLPATLAEKCIWSNKKASVLFCATPDNDTRRLALDDWYRGSAHFSDDIWFFDTSTDIARVLIEPKQSLAIEIDVIEPKLSPNEDYLIFINKTDMSLWALKLELF